MRPRTGPSKKLAPASRINTACSHVFAHDDGLYLEIDCEDCSGPHDLCSRVCTVGVINAATTGPRVESVVLKRMTHKRYRGDIVQAIMSAAEKLSELNRAISSVHTPEKDECRACSANRQAVLSKARSLLLQEPLAWKDCVNVMAASDVVTKARCARAHECVRRALAGVSADRGE